MEQHPSHQATKTPESPPPVPKWFGDWFRDRFPGGKGPFRPPEVWGKIECSKNAVYRAIQRSELKVIRVGGRYLIPRPALRSWLREQYFTRD